MLTVTDPETTIPDVEVIIITFAALQVWSDVQCDTSPD